MSVNEEAAEVTEEETVVEQDSVDSNDGEETKKNGSEDGKESDVTEQENSEDGEGEQFPKKAVNALNRKSKQINKLRAQLRDLEAKLNEKSTQNQEQKEINPDDFESYGDYINAQVHALVEQKTKQSHEDMQKQNLNQQKEVLKQQRDQYIIEQAKEVSKTFTDLPNVWQQNAQLLDALPESIADIFYSIDNAPAAVYTLAKEGKLESLLYANPSVAAYKILNAEKKGLEMLSKPKNRASQAPEPITKAKGTGSFKKQISPNDDVLKSLGFKK